MKRIALLLLFVFPVFKYTTAQTFQAGFYVGASMTDIPGTDNVDNDDDFEHLGFNIAGTVSARISPTTRLQMEIRFIQRGAQQNPAIVNDSASSAVVNPNAQYLNNYFTINLNYVDAVIGIKHAIHFNLHNTATDRYGIEGGVSIGTLVGYSYQAESVNYSLDLNLIDISPYIGIYYNITPHFYIEGRYSNSVNSALKHDNSANNLGFYNLYYGSWDAGHNVSFSLTLGFNFGGSSATLGNTAPPPAQNQSDDN
jgi:hypothetical protein